MSLLHQHRRLWQKHVIAENRRSIEGLLDTLCDDPTYIVMATGDTYRGKDRVSQFYSGLFEAMPDATFDLVNQYVSEEGVVEESVLKGTLNGALMGLAGKNKKVELPLIIVFPMSGEKFWGERMYFDFETLKKQLDT